MKKPEQTETERNKVLNQIKKKLIELKEESLDKRVKEIDQIKDSAKMFKGINMLSRKKNENPYIHDKDGRSVVNPEQIYRIINSHFQTQFKDDRAEKLEPFEGNP